MPRSRPMRSYRNAVLQRRPRTGGRCGSESSCIEEVEAGKGKKRLVEVGWASVLLGEVVGAASIGGDVDPGVDGRRR